MKEGDGTDRRARAAVRGEGRRAGVRGGEHALQAERAERREEGVRVGCASCRAGPEWDAGQAEVEFGPRVKRERSRAGERVGFEWAGFLGWVFLFYF
jgi:hypothetical protein